MSKLGRLCWLIGLALLVAGRPSTRSEAGSPCTNDHAPGLALVGYRNGVSAAEWLAESRRDASMPQVVATIPDIHVATLHVTPGQERTALETLRRDPRVAYAELDYAIHAEAASADAAFDIQHRFPLLYEDSSFDTDPRAFTGIRHSAVITPNDPDWTSQWGPAQIGAPVAWSVATGASYIVIAVLDTGIQIEHQDLSLKIWTNFGEIPDNGLDDDHNGKPDDIHGWHFYHRWSGSDYVLAEDADVRDANGHGTHVAGIAAAATNNGVGIAGVSWGARIMSVRVLDQYGNGWYSDIAAGIVYAANNGARIINLSLGGSTDSQTLRAAVDYARSRGALVVSAAGNKGLPLVYYPAAYEPVLAVAATDQSDQRADFSNYGPQVDVAAPGQDIYSTWCHQDIYAGLCQGSYYFVKSGTSMAAPHVSGVAALVWSRWPTMTAEAVAAQIMQTAFDVNSPGWDEYTGWGRLDAARAVMTLTASADLWIRVNAPPLVGAGQTFHYQLVYGNDGGTDAQEVWVTATAPASLTLSTPFSYSVPLVPADNIPYTLTITATVSPDVPVGAELIFTATIASHLDLTPSDNTARAVIRVGHSIFLPLLLREHSDDGATCHLTLDRAPCVKDLQ